MKMKTVNNILKFVMFILFVGWLFIWIMLPTPRYRGWGMTLDMKINSASIGSQGTNLVLLSFPMMIIAITGCIYLHLQKKFDKNSFSKSDDKKQFLNKWRRPYVVMYPLGILTAMELLFAVMFVVLLAWSLGNYLQFSFAHLHMYGDPNEPDWKTRLRSVSLRAGYVGNIAWAFLFFPVTRGSSILPLVGLTSEASIKYHIWLGHISNALFMFHSVGFVAYYAVSNQMSELIQWSRTWVPNVAGEIATVIMTVMWVLSFPRYRRKMFEVFFYTHQLYPLYIIFYALHVGVAYLATILPGIFLFLIDRYLRFLQSKNKARLISARLLPCDAYELIFSKTPGLEYSPTSILFVNVPSISKAQWHPFTMTSSSSLETNTLSIAVKCEGSWTQKLFHQLPSLDHLEVSVEGPYGPASSHFLRRDSLVMVSGGSGITPFISIIREIIFHSAQPNTQVPNLLLVCAFKNYTELAMLDLLLPQSFTQTDLSRLQLRIEAYITRETEQPDAKNLIQTVAFKPNLFDTPITAILGPNSWLWLAAIITSSFLMFLLFLGLLTRYYIFPIDHNTEMIYHFSLRVIWDMFIVCLCILVVASGVFLLQKRRTERDGKLMQIQNVEIPTPTTSPGSWFVSSGVDTELESLPKQSLVEATNVHFGERPNLKKILFDVEGSDVGVLVCGPKKMRHEVARICSSGLADNLHFEAISFNW